MRRTGLAWSAILMSFLVSACAPDKVSGPSVLEPANRASSAQVASAATTTINWSGHTWIVTTGSMAGGNTGSANNVWVDANGWLHLRITKSGSRWLCAEVFTTDDLGFGTYQWQVEAPIDRLDKNVVLGLFNYGARSGYGVDGQNEIDIEYARWGSTANPPGNWTVYPSPLGTLVAHTAFDFSLSGTYTTSRFTWSSTGVAFSLLGGFQAVTSTTNVISSGVYTPANPLDVPQQALPVGINLWLYRGQPLTGAKSVEVVIHSFTRV